MASKPAPKPATKSATPPARPLPADALQALHNALKSQSQAQIARRLGVVDGTVSNALKGRYIGNVEKFAERIRGELLKATVACPVLGEISTRICQDERAKPFSAATNPQRVQLWRQCRSCPHNPAAQPTKGDPS